MHKYSTITCKYDTKIEQCKQGSYFHFNINKHLSDVKYIYICHKKKKTNYISWYQKRQQSLTSSIYKSKMYFSIITITCILHSDNFMLL